ncbi:MAG: MOP flippase family protein [Bacteroidota bacterium]|nr:MOP flippase family protein [Bacteroidota bacterium]
MNNLKALTIKGVVWNTIGRVSNQVLQFIISVILMRLLSPKDYGLIAMAMAFIGFASIFSEFGFSAALIQKQNITDQHKTSIFWFNIISGCVLTGIFVALAPLIATFYNNNELQSIVICLSFSFIIGAIGIVPSTLLQKEMNFAIINKLEVAIVIFTGIVSILFAYHGFGVWCLIIQSLLSQLLRSIIILFLSPWKPSLSFSRNSIKELFAYSTHLTGYNIINYWARKADDLLVGKYMGTMSLGVYSRAYNLMLMPITQVISLVSNVMFPALSTIQNDKQKVKQVYINVVQVLSFVTFPLMIGLIVLAEPFVLVFFGQKWIEVVPIIQILSFVGVTQTLGNPTGWIYTSQGRTDWMFYWGLFGSGSIVVAIVIGVALGSIYTVSIAYLVINIILTYPVIAIPGKLINLKFIEVFKKVIGILISSLLMALVIWILKGLLPQWISTLLKFILSFLIGTISYIIFAKLFKVEAMQLILDLIKSRKKFSGNEKANAMA